MTTWSASLSVAISRRHKKTFAPRRRGRRFEHAGERLLGVAPWRQPVASPNIRGGLTEHGAGRFSGFRIGLLAAPSPRMMREWHRCSVRPRLQRRDRGGLEPPSLTSLPTQETGTERYSLVNWRAAYHGPSGRVKPAKQPDTRAAGSRRRAGAPVAGRPACQPITAHRLECEP
jgi:hypothetical protein